MTAKPGRIYEVKTPDFPIRISIEAKNLLACQAVVSDVNILVGGMHVGSQPVTVTSDGLTKSYSIAAPQHPNCDLISLINAFFPDDAPANAKYVVQITSNTGDTATTTMSVPVVNPSVAALVFQLRPEDQPA